MTPPTTTGPGDLGPRSGPRANSDAASLRTVLLADAVVVGLFALGGRSSHGEELSVAGWAMTAWPFAVGAIAGDVAATRLPRGASAPVGALVAAPIAVGVGMGLRALTGRTVALSFIAVGVGMGLRALTGRTVALSFIAVALTFLTGGFAAWRVAARARNRARSGTRSRLDASRSDASRSDAEHSSAPGQRPTP